MPKREWADVPEGALVLSQSVIGSLELSPCRVTTLPKGMRTEPSVAMFQGTVMHEMAENHIKFGDVTTTASAIMETADAAWQDEPHEKGKSWAKKLHEENVEAVDWAAEMGMLFQSWLTGPWAMKYRRMELLEAEVPRSRQLGMTAKGTPLYVVTGGIDAVFRDPRTGYVHIVDWKTAGRPWSKNDGHGLIQDDVYVWLLSGDDQKYWSELDEAHFTFEVGAFSNLEWRAHDTEVTCASIHNALERIRGWADFLELDPRPHLCTPLSMKARGWWARPNYNHGHCHTCKYLADEYDAEWERTEPAPLIPTEDVTS